MDLIRPAVAVFVSAAVCIGCIPLARRLARLSGMIAHPREDRFHSASVPLLGGPACLLGLAAGLMVWILMADRSLPSAGGAARLSAAAVIGAAGFLILGIWDDRWACSPRWKGAMQGLLLFAVLLFWRPEGRLGSGAGLWLAWLCAMVAVNAWNYLDHADGIFASTSAVASAVLAAGFGGLIAGQCASGALWGLCGTMVGFLVWNLPPARIFLGDAGSLPVGFLLVLACLALIDAGPPGMVPAAVAAHCVPLTDLFLVSISRLREGRNPFRGGRDHSAHRLTSVLGGRGVVVVFTVVAACFGAAGIGAGARHPFLIAVVLPSVGLLLAALLLRLAPPPAARITRPPV